MEYLSNIELYFTPPNKILQDKLIIEDEEFLHITKVMRHSAGDEIYVTDGKGKIYSGKIEVISKKNLIVQSEKILEYKNDLENITFCIPKLKSAGRFEFAFEKCTELGITNFIIFESERTISKSRKIGRLEKICLSSMKQSLRSFLPEIKLINKIEEIKNIEGLKIVFDQNAKNNFLNFKLDPEEKYYFVFGPEGGMTEEEINLFDEKYFLSENRLRTETAIIKCASFL